MVLKMAVNRYNGRMQSKLQWLLRRPAVFLRATLRLGLLATVQLVFVRLFGKKDVEYSLRIKGFDHFITIRGGQSSDAWVIYELLVRETYGAVGHLHSPGFIVDGGANIGIASLYFLKRYPTARVIAIEPSPANFEICRKNLLPYHNRVVLIQGAIWSTRDKLFLQAGLQEWADYVQAAGDRPGAVEAFPLASLIGHTDGKIDLLKLDIEGAEKEVFGSGSDEWLPAVDNLIIELHDKDCVDRFFSAMEAYRYDLTDEQPNAFPRLVACCNIRPPKIHALAIR